jgi:uncharacterized protein with PQ loop repeat
MSINLISTLGYTGGGMISFNAIPPIMSAIKDNVSVDMPDEKINMAVMFMNIIGGSLLIAYGILLNLVPIYMTFSVIVLANAFGVILKIGFCISENRNNTLY